MTTDRAEFERDLDDRTAPNAGTLGQPMGVVGLRLSADQLDHSHTQARWKPTGRLGFPLVKVLLIVGALVAVMVLLGLVHVLTPLF